LHSNSLWRSDDNVRSERELDQDSQHKFQSVAIESSAIFGVTADQQW